MKQSILQFLLLVVYSSILCGQKPFITTWKTDNPGVSTDKTILIPTHPDFAGSYNYDVDWDNDGVFDEFGIAGDVSHDFGLPGIYTIRIEGNFPKIHFNYTMHKHTTKKFYHAEIIDLIILKI